MTATDDDWEWVVPAESDSTSSYRGVDLSRTISLGDRICKLRAQAGLSPQDIEDYAGVKKADLLALEAGLLQMNAELATSLAMVLGVDPEDIAA